MFDQQVNQNTKTTHQKYNTFKPINKQKTKNETPLSRTKTKTTALNNKPHDDDHRLPTPHHTLLTESRVINPDSTSRLTLNKVVEQPDKLYYNQIPKV